MVETHYPSNYFKKSRIKVFEVLRKTTVRQVEEVAMAPLIVYLPGIFGRGNSGGGSKTAYDYYARGYHVLIVPNPISTDYLGDRPSYKFGDLTTDGDVVIEAIKNFIAKNKKVKWVELVSESYGSYFSLVVLNRDVERLIRRTTLVSPPIDLVNSMDNFDRFFDESDEEYHSICAGKKQFSHFVWDMITGAQDSDLDSSTSRCAKPIVSWWSFHRKMIQTAELLRSQSRGEGYHFSDQERRDYRFSHFSKEFTPDQPQGDPEIRKLGTLEYWISQLPSDQQNRVRIIASEDDPINERVDWDGLEARYLDSSNFIKLPWGGHVGFIMLNEYQSLLDINF